MWKDSINLVSPGIQTRTSAVGVGHLSQHAIIYRRMENSRTDVLLLAQSSTNLGHISLSSHHTKQFPVPHHAPTFSRIHTLGRIAPHPSLSRLHPIEVSWPLGNSPLPVNSPPTDLHTGSRRDSPPILNSPCQHTQVPLFPRLQSPPFCKSQLTSPSNNLVIPLPIVSTLNFITIRQNKFGFSGY